MIGFDDAIVRIPQRNGQVAHLAKCGEMKQRWPVAGEPGALQFRVEKMQREIGSGFDLGLYVAPCFAHEEHAAGQKDDREHDGDDQVEA